MLRQLVNRRVDNVDARRLERLEETRRQADADAVLDPSTPVPSYSKANLVQLGLVRIEIPQLTEVSYGLILASEEARIHVAGAETAEHRNLPGPTRVHCDR